MTVYGNVHIALKAQLATVAGVPDPSTWAAENIDFTIPDPSTPLWIRETYAPQTGREIELAGGLVRHTGTWFLDLFVPKNTGKQAVEGLTGALLGAFKPGSYLSANGQLVRLRTFAPSKGQNTDEWYQQPVMITWRADAVTP